MHGVNVEVVEMNALPAHACLQDAMQLSQRHGCRHQHAPPDHRADTQQSDLQLNDARGFFQAGHADLMPSPAQICNCPTVFGTSVYVMQQGHFLHLQSYADVEPTREGSP